MLVAGSATFLKFRFGGDVPGGLESLDLRVGQSQAFGDAAALGHESGLGLAAFRRRRVDGGLEGLDLGVGLPQTFGGTAAFVLASLLGALAFGFSLLDRGAQGLDLL